MAAMRIINILLLFIIFAARARAQIVDASGQPNASYPNLYAWFDAGNGVNGGSPPLDGAPVTSWFDLTGKGHTLVQTLAPIATKPVYRANGAGAFPSIEFDGDAAIWGDDTNQFGTIQSQRTIFIVAKAWSGGGYLFDSNNVFARNALSILPPNGSQQWTLTFGAPWASGEFPPFDLYQIHEIVVGAGLPEYYINGNFVGTASTAAPPLGGLVVGAQYNVANGYHGQVAEILIYDRALARPDRASIEQYLLLKYPKIEITNNDGAPNLQYPPLYAWFDAANGVNGPGQPADGASVTSWIDGSGKNHSLLQASPLTTDQPLFRGGIANGRPAVSFDGTDWLGGNINNFGTLPGGKTIFFAARASAGNGYLFDSMDANYRNAVYLGDATTPNRWVVFSGNPPTTLGPAIDVGVFQAHTVVFEPYKYRHYINGSLVSTGSTFIQDLGGLLLGSRYNFTEMLRGDIAEMIIYDSVLGAADRTRIEHYLLSKHPAIAKYNIPGAPQGIVSIDWNSDGRPDLATVNANNTAALLLGGAAGFVSAGSIAAGTNPVALAAADWNQNKIPDLLLVNLGGNNFYYYSGDGAGGFAPPSATIVTSSPRGIAVADFNMDGRLDAATANETTKNISIFLGSGTGTFAAPVNFIIGPSAAPHAIAAADITADGAPDVAVGNYNSNDIVFFTNNGSASFLANFPIPAGGGVVRIAVADMNNDALPDILGAVDAVSPAAMIAYQAGMGFAAPLFFTLPSGALPGNGSDVRGADWNRDGLVDLIVTSQSAGFMYVFAATPSGNYAAPVSYPVGASPKVFVSVDADLDGTLDLAVANFTTKSVSLQLNPAPPAAGVATFGSGTAGCAGKITMSTNSMVTTPNAQFAFTCANAPPNALGAGIVADSPEFAGSDYFQLNIMILVDLLQSTELLGFDIYTESEGNGFAPFPLPPLPFLVGKTFYVQSIFAEPTAGACTQGVFGLVSSNGLSVTVQL